MNQLEQFASRGLKAQAAVNKVTASVSAPTRDLRTPLAKARDEWLASKDGEMCRQGPASGEYLENRLTMAFLAGVDWATKHLKEQMP